MRLLAAFCRRAGWPCRRDPFPAARKVHAPCVRPQPAASRAPVGQVAPSRTRNSPASVRTLVGPEARWYTRGSRYAMPASTSQAIVVRRRASSEAVMRSSPCCPAGRPRRRSRRPEPRSRRWRGRPWRRSRRRARAGRARAPRLPAAWCGHSRRRSRPGIVAISDGRAAVQRPPYPTGVPGSTWATRSGRATRRITGRSAAARHGRLRRSAGRPGAPRRGQGPAAPRRGRRRVLRRRGRRWPTGGRGGWSSRLLSIAGDGLLEATLLVGRERGVRRARQVRPDAGQLHARGGGERPRRFGRRRDRNTAALEPGLDLQVDAQQWALRSGSGRAQARRAPRRR